MRRIFDSAPQGLSAHSPLQLMWLASPALPIGCFSYSEGLKATKEDQRIMGVETGGCPYTAIREDASINLEAFDRMLEEFPNADAAFVKSGGDNLAATFSPELSDLTIYVIDAAAGEKIPPRAGRASPRATSSSSTRPTWRPM